MNEALFIVGMPALPGLSPLNEIFAEAFLAKWLSFLRPPPAAPSSLF